VASLDPARISDVPSRSFSHVEIGEYFASPQNPIYQRYCSMSFMCKNRQDGRNPYRLSEAGRPCPKKRQNSVGMAGRSGFVWIFSGVSLPLAMQMCLLNIVLGFISRRGLFLGASLYEPFGSMNRLLIVFSTLKRCPPLLSMFLMQNLISTIAVRRFSSGPPNSRLRQFES
jgi:hypothetical protein